MIAVLLALTAGGAAVGSAVVARHRAQAAADLSARDRPGRRPARGRSPRAGDGSTDQCLAVDRESR
nr:pilus assembly protein TadG-related protein [Mycobacteroides abscessus]